MISNELDKEGEKVGSPWAMTDIFRIFAGLSMSARILGAVSHPANDRNCKV